MENSAKGPDVPDRQKLASQAIENAAFLDTKKGTLTPLKYRFQWERVNEVTLKLTDGEGSNVPTSHGQWAGYRTTKAVAWVIQVAPGQWLARCGDRACGPSLINLAKADAMAMAKGAVGCYRITDPISHLNALVANAEVKEVR